MKIRRKIFQAICVTVFIVILWLIYFVYRISQYNLEYTRQKQNNITKSYQLVNAINEANKYDEKAQNAISQKNYNEAIKYFEKELKVFPQGSEYIYYKLGFTYVLMEKYETAIYYLNESLKDSTPKNAFHRQKFYYRGLAYFNLKNFEQAKNDFEKVVTIKKISYNAATGNYVESDNEDADFKTIKKDAYKYLLLIELNLGNEVKANEYLRILRENEKNE